MALLTSSMTSRVPQALQVVDENVGRLLFLETVADFFSGRLGGQTELHSALLVELLRGFHVERTLLDT